IVLGVCPDPEPDQIGPILDRHRAIVEANPDRPEATDLLQVQRRVSRVLTKQPVTGVCQPLNYGRQVTVGVPEPWGRAVLHRSVQRPSRQSRSASSARASSRPSVTSRSNWRSQAVASNSANQARSATKS